MSTATIAPRITILTATYNRAHTLQALAESLSAQSYRDFEWIVVDDGSTDDSARVLAGIAARGALPLRIITTPNGGKHRALNRGIPEARGEWTYIVDSDDRLPAEALRRIAELADEARGAERLCGIMGLKAEFDGTIVGGLLPENTGPVDTASLTFVWDVRGDKAEVFLTEVLKRYPFPEFEGERFITECVVWFRMAKDGYRFLLTNEVLYLCEYRDDGLSAKSLELRKRNPRGTLLFYSEELALDYPARKLLREAANLVRFAIHTRRLGATFGALPARGRRLALAALPLGAIAWVRDALLPSGKPR